MCKRGWNQITPEALLREINKRVLDGKGRVQEIEYDEIETPSIKGPQYFHKAVMLEWDHRFVREDSTERGRNVIIECLKGNSPPKEEPTIEITAGCRIEERNMGRWWRDDRDFSQRMTNWPKFSQTIRLIDQQGKLRPKHELLEEFDEILAAAFSQSEWIAFLPDESTGYPLA